MVIPLESTPEVTSKTVSCVAVLKNPMKVAVPCARTCCSGGMFVPVMNMPGVIAVVEAVTTSVFGAKALMVAVTEPAGMVMAAPAGRMVPAGDTPGGQKRPPEVPVAPAPAEQGFAVSAALPGTTQ